MNHHRTKAAIPHVNWDRFWFSLRSPFEIAPVRLGIGLLAIIQFSQYFFAGAKWFGEQGLFNPEVGRHFLGEGVEGTGSVFRWSILYSFPAWAPFISVVGLCASVFLLLGLGSRIAPLVAWVALALFHHRAPLLLCTHEPLLSAGLAYLILDSGSYGFGLRPAFAMGPKRITSNIALRLFQVHFVIWIAFSLASMLSFTPWWNGQAAPILIRDGQGWLWLPNSWGFLGQCFSHAVIVLQVAILACAFHPSWRWAGRWPLYAFLACVLLLIGDWMYAATLFVYSLAVWPANSITPEGVE